MDVHNVITVRPTAAMTEMSGRPNTSKYTVHICLCGRIHFIDRTTIWDWLAKDPANHMAYLVCKDCGRFTKLYVTLKDGAIIQHEESLSGEEIFINRVDPTRIIAEKGKPLFVKHDNAADLYISNQLTGMVDIPWTIECLDDYEEVAALYNYFSSEDWSGVNIEEIKKQLGG